MIIVEGCDGAGKSTLIDALTRTFFPNLKLGPKASTSLGGVSHHREPEALSQWVDAEMAHWSDPGYGPRLYDRHPLISEPIYGPVVRNHLSPQFVNGWYRTRLMTIRHMALVIFVDPGWEAVRDALGSDPEGQMPGVVENARAIWYNYRTLNMSWTGKGITYCRTDPRSILTVVSMVDNHIKNWRF